MRSEIRVVAMTYETVRRSRTRPIDEICSYMEMFDLSFLERVELS